MNEAKARETLDRVGRIQREKQFPMTCPRCGKDTMRMPLHTNALSRHADCYVCSECGTDEAMRDHIGDVTPSAQWSIITEVVDVLNGVTV